MASSRSHPTVQCNKYDTYCKFMGYASFVTGSDKYGTVNYEKGALYGCKGHDLNGWYWWKGAIYGCKDHDFNGRHWWVVRPCFAKLRRVFYYVFHLIK